MPQRFVSFSIRRMGYEYRLVTSPPAPLRSRVQCQGEHKETQANLVVKLKAEAERTASLQKEIDALKGSLESAKSRAVELEKQVLVVPVETDDEVRASADGHACGLCWYRSVC